MDEKKFFEMLVNNKNEVSNILNCNSYISQFGLSLTKEDAESLVVSKKNTLAKEERIEFSSKITEKLIFAFCDSPYIIEDIFVEYIGALQDIFYMYKNETLDEIIDDDLIEYMREEFNGECQGSLEFLEETCLDSFAREIRANTDGFIGSRKYE